MQAPAFVHVKVAPVQHVPRVSTPNVHAPSVIALVQIAHAPIVLVRDAKSVPVATTSAPCVHVPREIAHAPIAKHWSSKQN